MKKKLLLVVLCLTAISLVGGGTLAFFNASDAANNQITMGNVDILLHDEDGTGAHFPVTGIEGVMPGAVVDKVVHVENTGDNPVYVRVKLTKTNFDDTYMSLNINTAKWTLGTDGYYYYNEAVAAGGITENLFSTVSFSDGMGNDFMDKVVKIDVDAQGVQSEHNGTSAQTATGWPID